ncbi:hypothetical protein niasHT_004286 [Heterodera trifolii]|uniref:Uncharacterized protein n=1 Tax=Heterodera trifolii TaxID=157864 RepID=A0ABD2LQ53_9BILA
MKSAKRKNLKNDQSLPVFVQVDDISSSVELGNDGINPEQHSNTNSLDDNSKEMEMREHLEEIECQTTAQNKSVFVSRFGQELKDKQVKECDKNINGTEKHFS